MCPMRCILPAESLHLAIRASGRALMRKISFPVLVWSLACGCGLSQINYIGKTCVNTCPFELVCANGVCATSWPDASVPATGGGQGGGGSPSSIEDGGFYPSGGGAGGGAGGGSTGSGGGIAGGAGGGMTGQVDAGSPPIKDAGPPDDPCKKCTATQLCINSVCIDESTIIGRSCETQACPGGFACTGSICVKNGSRFCASIRGETPTSCLDFDGSPAVDAQWETVQIPSGGSPSSLTTVQRSTFSSAPAALLGRVENTSPQTPEARIRRPMNPNWSSASISFDVKTELETLSPNNGEFFAVAEFLCLSQAGNYEGVWYQVYENNGSNKSTLVMLSPGNNFTGTSNEQPSPNGWTRVRLEAFANRGNGTLTGKLFFNNKLGREHTGPLCDGEWRVNLGNAGRGKRGTIYIDNVIFREQ
jgi:hypothetical protein